MPCGVLATARPPRPRRGGPAAAASRAPTAGSARSASTAAGGQAFGRELVELVPDALRRAGRQPAPDGGVDPDELDRPADARRPAPRSAPSTISPHGRARGSAAAPSGAPRPTGLTTWPSRSSIDVQPLEEAHDPLVDPQPGGRQRPRRAGSSSSISRQYRSGRCGRHDVPGGAGQDRERERERRVRGAADCRSPPRSATPMAGSSSVAATSISTRRSKRDSPSRSPSSSRAGRRRRRRTARDFPPAVGVRPSPAPMPSRSRIQASPAAR